MYMVYVRCKQHALIFDTSRNKLTGADKIVPTQFNLPRLMMYVLLYPSSASCTSLCALYIPYVHFSCRIELFNFKACQQLCPYNQLFYVFPFKVDL